MLCCTRLSCSVSQIPPQLHVGVKRSLCSCLWAKMYSLRIASMQPYCGGNWLPRPSRLPITCWEKHARLVARQAAHVESIFTRDDVARHMFSLEKALPSMSLGQLANAFSSCVHTYRAASLSQSAMSNTEESVLGIVDYYTNELPDQSWLLTLRAAVASQVAQHPAATTHTAAVASAEASAASPATESSSDTLYSVYSPFQLQHQHLSQILAALAALPIMVVQPLPIGFGTPRWYRPLAAADPAAWENWLADVAAVYATLLQQEQQQHQPSAIHTTGTSATAATAFVQQHGAVLFNSSGSSSDLGSCIAAAAASGRDSWPAVARRGAGLNPVQQQQHLLEQLAEFMIDLACCMRWSNVNVDDDRLQTQDFKDKVLHCLEQQLTSRPVQLYQAMQQHYQQQQQQQAFASFRPPTPEPQLQQDLLTIEDNDDVVNQHATEQPEQQQQEIALAGSFLHRLTYSMLLLLLPPPRPILTAFFDATAEKLPELFTLTELQGLVRGLLFLGAVPTEPWLRGLVGILRGRAQDLEQREVQGFVEGLRFFGTKARKAGWLRDATAQLEEFTLC